MTYNVLLVEPDPSRAESLATCLRALGLQVIAVDQFELALPVLKQQRFAVIVTAVRLGAYNGLHLIVRARSEQPGIAAIVTTAVIDPVLEAEARSLGASCFVAPWQEQTNFVSIIGKRSGVQTA